MKVLPRSFYSRNTLIIAKQLLGKYLIRRIGRKKLVGRIVETEAYLADDPASHAYKGRTPRCAPMFESPGHAYVYFIYGNHYCLNAVTERSGVAGAVLIRAIEPVSGIGLPTDGPGKLTKALKIDKRLNRADLTRGKIVIADGRKIKLKIVRTKRIGLSKASNRLLRFHIKDNTSVSNPR